MIREYIINRDGIDNGNVIPSGFKIKVHQLTLVSEENSSLDPKTILFLCTENASGMCGNDQIPNMKYYDYQGLSKTVSKILEATIEVDLDAIYGSGNWTK